MGEARGSHLRAKISVESRRINNSRTRHFHEAGTHLSLVREFPGYPGLFPRSPFRVVQNARATFPFLRDSRPYHPLIYISSCSRGNPPTCRSFPPVALFFLGDEPPHRRASYRLIPGFIFSFAGPRGTLTHPHVSTKDRPGLSRVRSSRCTLLSR